jgi:hypothetical protein
MHIVPCGFNGSHGATATGGNNKSVKTPRTDQRFSLWRSKRPPLFFLSSSTLNLGNQTLFLYRLFGFWTLECLDTFFISEHRRQQKFNLLCVLHLAINYLERLSS